MHTCTAGPDFPGREHRAPNAGTYIIDRKLRSLASNAFTCAPVKCEFHRSGDLLRATTLILLREWGGGTPNFLIFHVNPGFGENC
jgi:hypothetical protein